MPRIQKAENQRLRQFLQRIQHDIVDDHFHDQPIRREYVLLDEISKHEEDPQKKILQRLPITELVPQALVMIISQQLQ